MHDVLTFRGTGEQPTWNPDITGPVGTNSLMTPRHTQVIDNVLSAEDCASLIAQFDQQEVYPVGIDGYSNGDPERIGSFRAMAWAREFAQKLAPAFTGLPAEFHGMTGKLVSQRRKLECPFAEPGVTYTRIGSTPWMRFMRYRTGGMHVPHYDAPFYDADQAYMTLFSWVLYLNDVPQRDGGAFEFVNDDKAPEAIDRRDWTRMAKPGEVLSKVQPRRGRMLVFPHWLCHQVHAYTGPDHRYIIRGDLAYGVSR